MVALLCPHHSPTTARPGDRPCGETGCRPGQSPTALFAPFPDPKPVDFKGKRLELGVSPGWKSLSNHTRVGTTHSLILASKLYSLLEAEAIQE